MKLQFDFGAAFLVAFGLMVAVVALGMGGDAGTIVAVVCAAFIAAVIAISLTGGRPDGV